MSVDQLAVIDRVCAKWILKSRFGVSEGCLKVHPRVRLPSNGSTAVDLVAFDVTASMNNNTSRKVKNPLLFAAGSGFPFENYTENALLVPVTPATPAVLRDGEFACDKERGWGSTSCKFRALSDPITQKTA